MRNLRTSGYIEAFFCDFRVSMAVMQCRAAETMRIVFLITVVFLATGTVCQSAVDPAELKLCNAQTNCRDCIGASSNCSWCTKFSESPTASGTRCSIRTDIRTGDCALRFLENPSGGEPTLSQATFTALNQISPLQADISLRANEPKSFDLTVRPSNNYPIDLYLLMDLSYSMRDDLAKLKTLGAQLSNRIEGITPNFRLGFGSFVDKRLGSFANLDPLRLRDPCYPDMCQPPYSYHHVVNLTSNNNQFNFRVDQQVISGNQDFPEGGFDGFLQSIVCKKMIGWRDVSRKMLLYLSDAGFHFAGDGLLGGVVRPHDGQCHMEDLRPDSTGNIVYQHWDHLDYPSIGQIAEKLFEFDVIPIFAVVESIQAIYNPLVDELGRDRAYLGTLAADSSNVVDLVEELYYRISQRIVFAPEIVPGLSIKVTPTDCPGRVEDGVCTGVTINKTAKFSVKVTVTECTEELAAGPRQVPVRVVGFGTFNIQVDALCNCSCETQKEVRSVSCSRRGDLVCGICECDHGFFGEMCQCNSTGVDNRGKVLQCPTGIEGLECSGRGICTCGICECRKGLNGEDRFSGKACECDSTICESGGSVCSGSSQGECTCDGCRCLSEPTTGTPYNGTFCECSPNTQTCRDPSNSTDVCNGRGWCNCGQCSCFSPFFGTYCELCSGSEVCIQGTCDVSGPNGICTACTVALLEVFHSNNVSVEELMTERFLREAVRNGTLPIGSILRDLNGEKAIFLPESFSRQCNRSCTPLVIINQTLDLDYDVQGFLSTRCQYNRLACDYRYYVALNTTDGTKLPIHVEYPPYCPTTAASKSGSGLAIPPWAIALILILLLLLLGLLALALLKLLFMLLDWIEVRRFQKELGKTKYTKNENPLFHSPQKEYKNPIYGK